MNAQPQFFQDKVRLRFEPMDMRNLDAVVAIEKDVYPFPWSHRVFAATLAEGHECWVAYDASDTVVGYFVLMQVVDEAHLLTIAVRADLQGRGIGRSLLEHTIETAKSIPVESILLEVRPSNMRAVDLYERYGFKEIGRRKNYYEAANGKREEAIVMRLML